MRGDQHQWVAVQEQSEVLRVPAEEATDQPTQDLHPLPRPLQDALENRAGYGAPQDRKRSRRHGYLFSYSGRLKVFEGVPAPYDTKKREVIPDALRCTKLSSFRKFCRLGDLSAQVGWGKKDLIDTLEQKRKDRGENWHKAQIDKANQVRKALNLTEINKVRAELAQYGY
jgi:hypothetical protein